MRGTLSPELRGKIQPLVLGLFEQPAWITAFGLGFALFSMHGPIAGPITDHNGFLFLIAPWVCPWPGTVYFLLVPYNPYRGSPLIVGTMSGLDQRDPDAKRLVELYRSSEGRRALIQTSVGVSVILFTVMAALGFLLRDSLNWSILSPWFFMGVLGSTIGSGVAIGALHIAWGLNRWHRPT